MAENEFGAEKSELPTPRRITEARSEGQVAYSHEFTLAVELLVGFGLLAVMAPWLWSACAAAMRWALGPGLTTELTPQQVVVAGLASHLPLLAVLAIFLAVMFTVAAGLGVAQVGLGMSLKPLAPKISKINPLTGLGRLFGVRGLVRLGFSVAKIILLVAIAWAVVHARIPHSLTIVPDLGATLADDLHAMWRLAMILAAVLLAVGLGDLFYQRWQHTRDLMMTKQEVKEEMKQQEGSPEVKGKIRQMQRQMAQRRMMQEVPKADVVITNPTHVAVALKYEAGKMGAPVVLAKGYDAVAQKIKAIAAEHNIPMVENIELARALAKETEIGRAIAPRWFKAVAEILAAVYKLRRGAA